MASLQDKISNKKIRNKIGAWALSKIDFDISDELKSHSDIEISKNTLILGDVTIHGTLKLVNNCFLIVCKNLQATNFIASHGCAIFVDGFQVTNLLHVAYDDVVAFCFADSKAKYVLSGHSVGCLTLDGAKLAAEVVDNYVECKRGAELDFKNNNIIKTQFPNFISKQEWEEGDEFFFRKNAHLLGINNAGELNEEELFEVGYEAVLKLADRITVYDAADKIIMNSATK
jgi:hypothetical protein